MSAYPGVEYFNVTDDNGRIVLAPVPLDNASAVRPKLADLGIAKQDMIDVISWARSVPDD
ncbi:MAG: AbrB/MazE/SpoVT family DNA-binding domain-containing protein [Gammaproteobacteria bacterium]|nr:AbrB/MazE/SpoVT family DNA-binding domain-containing protein [Gammaproteobacteria bacterium]